jgi:hypothetical protein
MANPAESEVQNLLPVQAYFNVDGSFNTFIGQGQPFYATANPQQSGLQITNSTINSSVIGGITPAAANFTTATVLAQPVGATDVVNLLALQSYAAGISWKQPCVAATLANITLSGLQTIDGKAVVAGDRVLVKDQSTAANNGIYLASASAWTRSEDANSWDELICAITFIEYGTQAGGAWFCTAQDGGTLGVTAVNWSQFTTSATYSAGTGLTLTGTVFSITPVGTASTYGSASTVPVFTTNASGQVSSVTNTNIAIAATQITSGTIDSARLSGSYSGITGLGTLTDLTVTNAIVGSITGNAATATLATSATSATTATNIAGGAAGSVPYQTASSTTGFLAAGTNGQVLTLASGVPSWATPTTGTVTSVSGTGTVSGISLSGTVTSTGSLTLGGTLDLSSPPAIGGTTANTVRGTTITATSSFVGTNFDASGSGGGSLRNLSGAACLQWGGGGGVNVTIDGAINMNGANSAIQINPTGTGTVSIAPAGALTVNPTTASTMNNVAIGGTTPLAGTFTDLRFNGTLSLAGSTGTSGYVLTSNGASAPTWQANANGLAITDDTTTNATRYLTFTDATSGSITGANVSSTKLAFIPSSGNFGIGTSSPLGPLQIGTAPGTAGTGFVGLTFRSSTNPTAGEGYNVRFDNTQNVTNDLGQISYSFGGGSGASAGYMFFSTAASEQMRITSSGNVGIGTSSPSVKLQISANGGSGDGAQLFRITDTNTANGYGPATLTFGNLNHFAPAPTMAIAGTNGISFCVGDGSDFATQRKVLIDSSGNVGIGTNGPTAKLHVYGGSNNQFKVESSGAEANFTLAGTSYGQINNSVGDWYLTNDTSNSIIFRTASTERMRITGGGNLLAGTTTADGQISVERSGGNVITAKQNSAGGWCYKSNAANNSSSFFHIEFLAAGTAVGSITSTTSTTSYVTTSDYRLKENVAPMTDALDKVVQLKPCTYTWKSDGSKGQGFIAHELAEIVPDCVNGEKDAVNKDGSIKPQGIDTSFLVATLTAAIQELKTELDSVKAELQILKGN